MFRNNTAPAVEAVPQAEDARDDLADLVPVSHLQLDLPDAPVGGWTAYLAGRGIPIVADHIGRDAISSADARQLLDERREDEARKRELAKRQEAAAVEADRQFRTQLHPGIPAGTFGDLDPIRAQIAAEVDADPRRCEMAEELWSRRFGRSTADEMTVVIHLIRDELADES